MTGHRVNALADAAAGERKIEWAAAEMPVLGSIEEQFARDRPLAGLRTAW